MKRIFLVLILLFECISLPAQLYSNYELCISDDPTFKNPTKHEGVFIDLELFVDNQYEIVLIDDLSYDNTGISYLSIGTYRLVFDTLELTERNDKYKMKFLIQENGDLMPLSSFSGFERKSLKGFGCVFSEPYYTDYVCKRCLRKNTPLRCRFSKMPSKGHYCDGDMKLSFEEGHYCVRDMKLLYKEGHYCLTYSGFVLSEGKCEIKRNRLELYDPFLNAKLDVVSWRNTMYLKFCYYQFLMNPCN